MINHFEVLQSIIQYTVHYIIILEESSQARRKLYNGISKILKITV